jgi:asparagine synthase (glutamine-hydrolysing)
MCRIHGYFNSATSPNEMRTVAALQRHGGPDHTAVLRDGHWGLGYNRLAVMDPGGGTQPYLLGDRIAVVFNGEIYNHKELRQRLQGRGYTFSGHCDGNVLPALFEVYGDRFVDEIDGMYALAVLDRRGPEPTLRLATDHAGMKPLYYRWDAAARSLHFSSEIGALLGFRGDAPRVWEPGLDAYLTTKTPFGEQTMFESIRVLPPASLMRCVAGRTPTITRHGQLPETEPGDDAQLRELLRTEVHRLLHADVPVAVITSGGLDSSLVTALAARQGTGPLHAFNIAYRGKWPFDERAYAEAAAGQAGARFHQVELDPARIPELIGDVVWHLGQPNADPITVSTYALFAAVREAGFKVALTGDAADEAFGGYHRMRVAAAAADWLPGYLDDLAAVPAAARRELYTADYREVAESHTPVPAEALERLAHGGGSVLDRITEFELRHRLPAYHLRRVDHLSMASSVEARLPFCQRSVLSWGRALPDSRRIQGSSVKRALYGAAAGVVPESVLRRPKQPFTLPVAAMLRPAAPLWEYARDLLASDRLRTAGRLDPIVVDGLFRAQAERPDASTALTLWSLMTYESWREQFTAGVPSRGQMAAVA